MKFIVQFAQYHPNFRIQELFALAELHSIEIQLVTKYSIDSPFLVISLESEVEAKLLVSRSILVKYHYT